VAKGLIPPKASKQDGENNGGLKAAQSAPIVLGIVLVFLVFGVLYKRLMWTTKGSLKQSDLPEGKVFEGQIDRELEKINSFYLQKKEEFGKEV